MPISCPKSLLVILFILTSCLTKEAQKASEKKPILKRIDKPLSNQHRLFKLKEIISENFVRIIPPVNSDFEFPDPFAKKEPYKNGDFNADGKQDILVYLGACGTGGCMYGLFLNQHNDYYKLTFMDYLKNAEFKVEENNLWSITSSEEIEPYNPSKIEKTIFKFDQSTYQYKIDTIFGVNQDK